MDYSFNKEIAERYGVAEAVLLRHLGYWILKNETAGRNFHDGRYWTYNSAAAFAERFPFWSRDKIKRLIRKLRDRGAIITGNYNKKAFDRTGWYALPDELLLLCREGETPPEAPSGNTKPLRNQRKAQDGTQSYHDDAQSYHDGVELRHDETKSHRDGAELHHDETKSRRASGETAPPIPDIKPKENTKETILSEEEIAEGAIAHLNRRARKKFRVTPYYLKEIRERMAEGAGSGDFLAAIDNAAGRWDVPPEPGRADMRIYLRPDTLFGPKFWSYVNMEPEKRRAKGGGDLLRMGIAEMAGREDGKPGDERGEGF